MTRAGFQGDLSEQNFAVLKEPKQHMGVKSGGFKAGYGNENTNHCKLFKYFG